jgi:hypothetical protein
MAVALHETALSLLGPDAELLEVGIPGRWLGGFLLALTGQAQEGTHDPLRRVVAEHLLDLPRD